MQDEHGAQWQMDHFLEFCKLKRAVGEPSPHMTLVVQMMGEELDDAERIWRIGCYTCSYSALTAEVLWNMFPFRTAIRNKDGLREFIKEEWAGFHIRTERRMVRTPDKFAVNLLSWLRWEMNEVPFLPRSGEPRALYDTWYDSIMEHVMYHGRYITIRAVEGIRRATGIPLYLYDIRSIGGESPVRCLSLLYPEHEQALLVDKNRWLADRLAGVLLDAMQREVPGADHYMLAAMLCEYREAYEDRHQYPARTIDQELEYLNGPKAAHWRNLGYDTGLWQARKEVTPAVALGELNGWGGVRHDLSRWLRDKGQNWSDHVYQYPSGERR